MDGAADIAFRHIVTTSGQVETKPLSNACCPCGDEGQVTGVAFERSMA